MQRKACELMVQIDDLFPVLVPFRCCRVEEQSLSFQIRDRRVDILRSDRNVSVPSKVAALDDLDEMPNAVCMSCVMSLASASPAVFMAMCAMQNFGCFSIASRLYRCTRAPAPAISASTSFLEAMDVSPGVVMARAPCAAP